MVIGKSKFSKYPEWFLGSQRICVTFDAYSLAGFY